MENVILAILTVAVVIGLGLCFALLRTVTELRKALMGLGKQVDGVTREVESQGQQLARLREVILQREPSNDLVAVAQRVAGGKSKGITPTIVMIGWQLIRAYLNRRSSKKLAKK